MEAIRDSAVYAKETDGYLPGLYYLVAWKGYPEEENTWEPFSAVMHLRKMINTFHKDHPEKLTTTSAPLDSAPPMAKSTNQLPAKRKRGRPTRHAKKRAKWGNKEEAIRRNPSQCGSRARNRRVAGDLSPWRGERCRGACMVVDHGSSTSEELNSTLFWPSPSISKSLIIHVPHRPNHIPLLSTNLGFSFFVFSPGWKVCFINNIYTLWSFGFLPRPPHRLGCFSLIDLLSGFPPTCLPSLGCEVFHQQHDLSWDSSASLRG